MAKMNSPMVHRFPHVELFFEQAQLYSTIIMQLKGKWPCAQHQGESGDTNYCYIYFPQW
ncbi:hypothetical protein PILCRDRAFT_7623 [Piloderma croceum F 1598]|uniref:Uncharacterized protein n=1 Tax=Piloderma croceum (strain F 1598) TaxID=765440 RepID=A0A0C3FW01_PILCF|nr:hypothetical protein PILCRDRAFT_7623 [Piloderma croceum F 1598]